jgi:hypothetical protein
MLLKSKPQKARWWTCALFWMINVNSRNLYCTSSQNNKVLKWGMEARHLGSHKSFRSIMNMNVYLSFCSNLKSTVTIKCNVTQQIWTSFIRYSCLQFSQISELKKETQLNVIVAGTYSTFPSPLIAVKYEDSSLHHTCASFALIHLDL